MKDVEEWLEEQRHNLFTCFRCGRFGKADEFIVLDWETADGEERLIYVCHCCLEKYGQIS